MTRDNNQNQRQITTLWPERVKRSRTHSQMTGAESAPTPGAKRVKTADQLDPITANPPPAKAASAPVSNATPKATAKPKSPDQNASIVPAVPHARVEQPSTSTSVTMRRRKQSDEREGGKQQEQLGTQSSCNVHSEEPVDVSVSPPVPRPSSPPTKRTEPKKTRSSARQQNMEKTTATTPTTTRKVQRSPVQQTLRSSTLTPAKRRKSSNDLLPPTKDSATTKRPKIQINSTTASKTPAATKDTPNRPTAKASSSTSSKPPLPPPSSPKQSATPTDAEKSSTVPPNDEHSVDAQKKKWRLSELIKKDREAKRMKEVSKKEQPFVLMPTAAESTSKSSTTKLPPSTSSTSSPSPSPAPTQSDSVKHQSTQHPPQSPSPVSNLSSAIANLSGEPSSAATNQVEAAIPAIAPSASKPPLLPKRKLSISSSAVPGADALLYDRSKLPDSFALLLDVMNSMEIALGLLRTRRIPPSVAAVREIVQRDTRRDFTLRTLAQLAAVAPECVAVTMPKRKASSKMKTADSLIIRLDDPENDSGLNLFASGSDSVSELGDGVKRLRKAFLHRRLLEIVREHHSKFVQRKKNEIAQHAPSQGPDNDDNNDFDQYSRTAVWHPEFDPNRDVPPLPAPPLFDVSSADTNAEHEGPPRPNTVSATGSSRSVDQLLARCEKKNSPLLPPSSASISTESSAKRSSDDGGVELSDDEDDGIPKSLLARVRSRQKAKEQRAERAEEERSSNRSLISKLPCTMDTINTVLRTDRRSAMGWTQLLNKVVKVHPRKWDKDEIEQQMDAIVKLATDWCTKVELKSSRGGFAFRVVSEKAFAKARSKVCSTTSM